jgi:fucose 4-O-acetylase-like acetyltransferase
MSDTAIPAAAAGKPVKQSSRILWVDLMRFIGIFLVVMTHMGPPELTKPFLSVVVIQIIVFVSGYLEKNDRSFGDVVKTGVRTLLVPYVLLYLIIYVYWIFIDFVFHRDIYTFMPRAGGSSFFTLVKPIIGMLLGNGEYETPYSMMLAFPMWYLPAIFFVRIFHKLIVVLSGGKNSRYFACLAAEIVLILLVKFVEQRTMRIPFCIDCALLMLPYFEFGNILRRFNLVKPYDKDKKAILLYLLIALTGLIIIFYTADIAGLGDINVFQYGNNLFLYILLGIVGIITILAVSQFYTREFVLITMLSNGSLVILAFHVILIPYINMLSAVLGFSSSIIYVLFLTILNIGLMIIPVNIIQRYCPILVGGRKIKK